MVSIFKKTFDYFNTNDMGELEETDSTVTKDPKPIGKPLPRREEASRPAQKSIATGNKPALNRPKVSEQEKPDSHQPVRTAAASRPTAPTSRPSRLSTPSTGSTETQTPQQAPLWSSERVQPQMPPLPKAPTERPRQQARVQTPVPTVAENDEKNVRITIKYPQRYEDAPAIVDLLMAHETILIDFEYMDEVQARRCIDFLDGASRVLAGSLQRVGGSLYLLAPKHVLVTAEELRQASNKQDLSYDYDMKRR